MPASACHIGWPIGVDPGRLALVYGSILSLLYSVSISLQFQNQPKMCVEKGSVSAHKTLQGSETETGELLGGKEEKSV